MLYNILDFEAVIKHSYYGSRGTTSTLLCTETGQQVIPWQAGAADFIQRYLNTFDTFRSLIVAHDGGTDYRSAFYPEYKAKRKKVERSPLEIEQVKLLKVWAKNLLAAIGSTQIHLKGVEADDIIAWICSGQNVTGIVHTVDADLLQLVSDDIAVNLKGEMYFGDAEYKGIPTSITSISKSMVGDSSDGYNGIKGFGEKALEALYEEIGEEGFKQLQTVAETRDITTLKEAVESRPDSKPLKKILDNWEDWMIGWRLARLHPELCWKPRARKLVKPTIHKRIPNKERTYTILKEAGTDDLFAEYFENKMPNIFGIDSTEFDQMLDDIKAEILAGDKIAFDYETTDYAKIERFREASSNRNFVDVLSQTLTGASFCFGEHGENVIYIPVDHAKTNNVPKTKLVELLDWLQQQDTQKIAHNFSFEGSVTRREADLVLDNVHDTMIMQRYYDENAEAGLKSMSLAYLGYHQKGYKETLDDNEASSMAELTLDQVLQYGADDALTTFHLHDLMELLLKLDQQYEHYCEWAVEPSQVLQTAFNKGVTINWALQKRLHEADLKTIEEGLQSLRDILKDNVSGELTGGCKSFIEAEQGYMAKRFKASHPEEWKSKYSEWIGKVERACVYVPYEEIVEEPKFAYTANNLNAIAKKLDLPTIEKNTISFISGYLEDLGITKLTPTKFEGDQKKFLDLLSNGLRHNINRLNKEETLPRLKAFEDLRDFFIEVTGAKGKTIKVGDELNVGSSSQMQDLIYCKIGVPVRLFGTSLSAGRKDLGVLKAAPATDEKSIQTALANDVERGSWQEQALKILLKVKSATTRVSLYHAKMPLWIHEDGRIHPYVRDSGTDTRRPTGGNPNILQIPARGEGAAMRSMYMPPHEDWVCVAIDFSGQELRIMASEAKDRVMTEAYTPGKERDIHSTTAAGIVRSRLGEDHPLACAEELDKARKDESHPYHETACEYRDLAKGVNFLMSYLGSFPTLARNLMIPETEAKTFLEAGFSTYPRIGPWQDEVSDFMLKNGFTQTAFGTRRHALPYLFSQNKGEVSRMLRQGVNATIQGCAAEALKTILTKLYKEDHLNTLRMQFFAPIYDEVVSFVHKDDVLAYWKVMKRLMTEATPPGHDVPQVPELSIGGNWGNTKELGSNPTEDKILSIVEEAVEKEKVVWETDMKKSYSEIFKITENGEEE